MIITFDLHKFSKKNKINKSKLARKIGVSPQLLQHHFNKGDVPFSYIINIADFLQINPEELCLKLLKNYIKKKL
tara:strand:+ start:9367 stop:9588 length:222 start_codon:yes stop_codon:yes gene_type:complete